VASATGKDQTPGNFMIDMRTSRSAISRIREFPAEVRIHICRHYFGRYSPRFPDEVINNLPVDNIIVALLPDQRLYDEVSTVYYEHTLFCLDPWTIEGFKRLKDERFKSIRHLRIRPMRR
jgi:hypothetical protein